MLLPASSSTHARSPRLAAFVLLGALLAALPASAAVTTTFNSSAEGWLVTGDNASVWSATGGNPGGCFDVNDLATGANNLAVAPPAYLGDWSTMTAADSIKVDIFFDQLSGSPSLGPYQFRISGPGGAAHALQGYQPPENVWATAGTSMNPLNWVIESGTWPAILAHVTTVLIEAEFVSGNEEVRFDNVRLTGNVTPVFLACETETFPGTVLNDWSFSSTGGVTNPGTGGNGGGFCRVVDGTGTSVALAPARFLGNLSSLNGTGALTVDFRLVSVSGPVVGTSQFIRLSGPGGIASVALTPAEIPASTLVWKTLRYPLTASAWNVSSGTWAGLLANVTECRIEAEVVNGSEIVGLDNFGRLAASCGIVDDPIVVATPDIVKCGILSLVGVSSVARNPTDAELYGIIDLASASGGGLYPLTGPTAGIRLQAYTTPAHLIFDGTGAAFVTEDASGNIFRFAGGVSSTWVSGLHSGDDDPMGLCFAPAGYDGPNVDPGDVLVTDYGFSGPDEIWSFKTTIAEGELQIVPDITGTPDFLDLASGGGNVYTVNSGNPNNLYTLSPTGVLSPIALSTPLTSMVGIAYDPSIARLYVVENGGHTLRRIHPGTGAVELIASGFTQFGDCGVEVQAANGRVSVVDLGMNRVYEFCRTASTGVEDVANAGPEANAPVESIVASLSVSPNPARTSGTIVSYMLRRSANVRVTIHDLSGRVVCRLNEGRRSAGNGETSWDGRDGEGNAVAAGMYLARIEADGEAKAARVTVLR